MAYLNKNIEALTKKVSSKSLANRSITDGIFKISDYNIFLVKESGQGPRSLSF
ncbi:hypothetical protein [Wenyingzhuangia fucanilytica]|uniref:hypothetical protein n=1 Tax=Wenyingzhuangia fucanilytica TaxID=1790137 RepID=UPI0012F715E8|nr:hypothetical protein [Wenyingzhuangia fucanilytica]